VSIVYSAGVNKEQNRQLRGERKAATANPLADGGEHVLGETSNTVSHAVQTAGVLQRNDGGGSERQLAATHGRQDGRSRVGVIESYHILHEDIDFP